MGYVPNHSDSCIKIHAFPTFCRNCYRRVIYFECSCQGKVFLDPPRNGRHKDNCPGFPLNIFSGTDKCLVCGRKLTAIESQQFGVGPTCRERDYKHAILLRTIHGADVDVNAANEDGVTRAHLLARHAEWTERNPRDKDAYMPENTLDGWLCRPNVKVDARDVWGETPLHYAAAKDACDAIHTLVVVHNADVNNQDNKGNTPAHAAAARIAFKAMRNLAKRGADMSAQNKDGETPLHMAVMAEAVEIAKAIVEYGTPKIAATVDLEDVINCSKNAVGIKDKSGAMPLHYALSKATVKKLLNCGADASMRDCFGRTPWNYAEQKIAQMEKDVSPKQTEIDYYFGTSDCDNDGKANARKAVSDLRTEIAALLCPE